jgi:hypothetical protein
MLAFVLSFVYQHSCKKYLAAVRKYPGTEPPVDLRSETRHGCPKRLLLKWLGNSGIDAHEKSRSWAVRVWPDDDLAVAGRNLQRASRLTRQGVIQ